MILKTSTTSLDTLFNEADSLRTRFEAYWGPNKKEEIVRLLFDIARREDSSMEAVYSETLALLRGKTPDLSEKASFHKIKEVLLARRYPSLKQEEYSKVLLNPIRRSDETFGRLPYEGFKPSKIYVEEKSLGYPLTRRVLARFPEVPVETIPSLKNFRQKEASWLGKFGKDTLLITTEEFDLIKPCACTSGALECNYHVLNLGFGCPFDCSYCYLQFYQNTPAIVIYANPERFTRELDEVFAKQKGFWTRIGTGEFTDSLALDPITEYTKTLVPYFKDKNVFFELKTKSDNIENLIGLDHGGKTVVAWSVNPSCLEHEESKTASIARRIAAARRVQEAGYPIAFHFDPLFFFEGWEKAYQELVDQIYDSLLRPPQWLSLGMFRFHRDLKKVAEYRHPETRIFLGEQVQDTQDDKFRYPKRIREEIYQKVLGFLKARDSKTPIYLCMETPELWRSTFQGLPYEGRIDSWIAGTGR